MHDILFCNANGVQGNAPIKNGILEQFLKWCMVSSQSTNFETRNMYY